jgi:predicted ribosome quality control (RQC) complex YloA/Tae2 family protein
MKFREIILESGTIILLGKDAKSNEELVKQFRGKKNTIMHTIASGSPFCVIKELIIPSRGDINTSGAICAAYSQDWRDNKADVKIHAFTGKDVYKRKGMKLGTFGVKKFKVIKVKKEDIIKFKK